MFPSSGLAARLVLPSHAAHGRPCPKCAHNGRAHEILRRKELHSYPTLAVPQDDSRGGHPIVLASGLQDIANRQLRLAPIHPRTRRKECGMPASSPGHQDVGIVPDVVAVSGGCWRNATPIVVLRRRCRESAVPGGAAGDSDPLAYALVCC